jgi:hypothetical protein
MLAVLALAMVIGSSGTAWAILVDFDTLNGGAEGLLPGSATSATVAGVLAEGFQLPSTPKPLWLRNTTNDHGLGVCSEGSASCAQNVGGGDVNEVSSLTNPEGIRLTLPTGFKWTSLFVSSLDSGGTNSHEKGLLYWSSSSTFNTGNSHFGFGYGDFGTSVEGNILSLAAAANFDPTAKYLWFVDDSSNCIGSPCIGNNDYLVWKGDISAVPEPTTAALVGTVLVGLMIIARRRTRRA